MDSRASAAGLERLSLEELQDWHATIVLAVVRGHGVPAAMNLIGHSLQSLAAQAYADADKRRQFDIMPSAAISPARRWQATMPLALRAASTADPWRDRLSHVPVELAIRRTWDHTTNAWKAECVLVRVEREAFAHGAMRQCFRMKILRSATRGWSGAAGTNYVAKSYMSGPNSAALLEADVRMQTTAKWYAERFNEQRPPKPVDFVQCAMVALPSRGVSFGVETFLAGDFTKYSSNSGFVTDEVVRHTPHALSHYTYERSDGHELLVDVQVRSPAISRLLTPSHAFPRRRAGAISRHLPPSPTCSRLPSSTCRASATFSQILRYTRGRVAAAAATWASEEWPSSLLRTTAMPSAVSCAAAPLLGRRRRPPPPRCPPRRSTRRSRRCRRMPGCCRP